MFDKFLLYSDFLLFSHTNEDWLIETNSKSENGTFVHMEIANDSQTTAKEVFDRYSDLESGDYGFSKTHVPLALAKYGNEQLISRSQAKRVLRRFEKFEEVFLDFHGVDSIGQAFADEIFRVFHDLNPDIKIVVVRANAAVNQMIERARSPRSVPSSPPTPNDPA